MKAIEEKERVKKEKLKQQEERKQRIEKRKKEKAEQMEGRRKNIEVKKQKEASNPTQRKARKGQIDTQLTFTEEEVKRFETRFENGYDLKDDERYNSWLKTRTSESEPLHQAGR